MVDFSKVTDLKNKLTSMRPLSKMEVEKIREFEKIEDVYNSNALEGNTITKFETKMILEEGITISEKPMREHLEIVNLSEAYDFVEDLVRTNQPLSERLIKEIHSIVYNKLAMDREDVGNYRRIDVGISASDFEPTSPLHIEEEMQNLLLWSEENKGKLHPVKYAATLHEKFVTIHPFINGNGRTARLLMNFALTQAGYPSIVVKADPASRIRYNQSLQIAQVEGNSEPFLSFILELTTEKLEKMVNRLEMKNEVTKKREKSKKNDIELDL